MPAEQNHLHLIGRSPLVFTNHITYLTCTKFIYNIDINSKSNPVMHSKTTNIANLLLDEFRKVLQQKKISTTKEKSAYVASEIPSVNLRLTLSMKIIIHIQAYHDTMH
jgi:hypothetical protein